MNKRKRSVALIWLVLIGVVFVSGCSRLNDQIQTAGAAETINPAYGSDNYNIIDLGDLGGGYSIHSEAEYPTLFSLNDKGEVSGTSKTAGNLDHPFRTQPNSPMTVFDDLYSAGGNSFAGQINNNGAVVGGLSSNRAFRTSNYAVVDDYALSFRGVNPYSYATGINDSGQVVGFARTTTLGMDQAILVQPSASPEPITLPRDTINNLYPGKASRAYAISSTGQVTGYVVSPAGEKHAFLYKNGQMTDLGTLGGNMSKGYAIHDSGLVVGESVEASGFTRGFIYELASGMMFDLGTLGGTTSRANGINDDFVIVGHAMTPAMEQHAMILRGQGVEDLNTLIPAGTITLNTAHAINNLGQIVASGVDSSTGKTRVCLLTPAPDTGAPVIDSVSATPRLLAIGDTLITEVLAHDNRGVARVLVDGVPLSSSDHQYWTGSLTITQPLGIKNVTISVSDHAGNVTTDSSLVYEVARVVFLVAKNLIIAPSTTMKDHVLFKVAGRVVQPMDADSFTVNDGSGVLVRIVAPGYSSVIQEGDFAGARGQFDGSIINPTLTSTLQWVQKY